MCSYYEGTLLFYSRHHIESAGHTCELRDAAEFQSPAEVAKLTSQYPAFDGALAIHLYKAGRLLLGKCGGSYFMHSLITFTYLHISPYLL